MKKRVMASLFAASVGMAAVAGLAQTMAEKGGTMTVALPGDIISLDPAFDYDFNTSPVVQQLVEGLQRFDENNKVVPNIAESVSNPNPLLNDRAGVEIVIERRIERDDVTGQGHRHRATFFGHRLRQTHHTDTCCEQACHYPFFHMSPLENPLGQLCCRS